MRSSIICTKVLKQDHNIKEANALLEKTNQWEDESSKTEENRRSKESSSENSEHPKETQSLK